MMVVDLIKTDALKKINNSSLLIKIGSYWKINRKNFTVITYILKIQGDLYYKFYSLISVDGISIVYLIIDENLNLIVSYPNHPDFNYIDAKFNT
jgi:hypothetical protein